MRLAELDAATEQHLPAALADACCELADQPGFADPGLAANADRHRGTAAGLCEGRLEAVELSAPANEAVACDAAGHVTDYALEQIRRERPAAYRAVPAPVDSVMFGFLVILGWPLIEFPPLGPTRCMPNPWSPRVTFQVREPWRGLHAEQEPGARTSRGSARQRAIAHTAATMTASCRTEKGSTASLACRQP